MSTSHVSAELRRLVAERANRLCEYCLIAEEDTFLGCEVDHIIGEKHAGLTREDNLAYACAACNRSKGSNIASLLPGTTNLVRLFNPRTDSWSNHFLLDPGDGAKILPRTPIGAVTVHILGFNSSERLLERQALAEIGCYPPGGR